MKMVRRKKKEFTKRVSITKNDRRIVVSIKAPAFSLGNGFLTFILSLGIIGELIIGYLMVLKPSHLEFLFPLLIGVTGIFIIAFTRMWLWHHFGEEHIEILDNKLTSSVLDLFWKIFRRKKRSVFIRPRDWLLGDFAAFGGS